MLWTEQRPVTSISRSQVIRRYWVHLWCFSLMAAVGLHKGAAAPLISDSHFTFWFVGPVFFLLFVYHFEGGFNSHSHLLDTKLTSLLQPFFCAVLC